MFTRFPFIFILLLIFSLNAMEFTVPRLTKAPVIDGRLDPQEWNSAFSFSGAGNPVDPRRTQIYLGWTADGLYIAARSETPPGGKLKVLRGAVVADDSLEFWFDPPKNSRIFEQAKFGEFQLLVNSIGTLFQKHHNPGYGLPVADWKSEAKVVNKVENELWTFEMVIPAQAFGLDKITPADWKILFVRNFRTKPELQAPFTPVQSFSDSTQYATFHLTDRQGAVQHLYNESSRHPAVIRVSSGNGGSSCEVVVEGKTYRKNLHAGENEFDFTALLPAKGAQNISIIVKDDLKNLLFKREISYKAIPDRVWFTPESYIFLDHHFSNGMGVAETLPANGRVILKGSPEMTEGYADDLRGVKLTRPGDSIRYANVHPTAPGCISLWIKLDKLPEKPYRRLISTIFKETGYFGIQEMGSYTTLFLHNFEGPPKNLTFKKLPVGQWIHLTLNLFPTHLELYQNGIKLLESTLPFEINPDKLGDIVLGSSSSSGFTVGAVTAYNRTLSENEIKSLVQGNQAIAGEMFWFPSINAFILDLTCKTKMLSGDIFSLELNTAKGDKIWEGKVSLTDHVWRNATGGEEMITLRQKISVGKVLPEGNYILSLINPSNGKMMMEKSILVKHYPWLGNNLGKEEKIYPPFTALKVNGNKISCILREYEFGANGLPAQITSLGQNILAGPIRLYSENHGKISGFSNETFELTRVTDTAVEYTGGSAGSLDAAIKGRMEFDGFIRIDMKIGRRSTPPPERFYLDIPVKKEFAVLYHACGQGLRSNPAGFLPNGTGVIWKSSSIPQLNFNNFIPYIWIGDDERGICFAADNANGWALPSLSDPSYDAVELIRESNGDVIIRVNFLSRPYSMDKERNISFALMASPAKPQPQGWRGWLDGYSFNANKVSRLLGSPPWWGAYTFGWGARYPEFMDFNYIRKLVETQKSGVIDETYKKNWIARVLKNNPSENPQRVISHTEAGFAVAKSISPYPNALLYPYTCNADSADKLPEFPVMRGEWGNGFKVSIPSYADYALYYLRTMLECGLGGVYDDNTFFVADFNWATGNAWIDDNGTIHPSAGLWNNRDYLKRQFFLMHSMNIEPWITVHNTNANILPVLSLASNSMGMEWKYGLTDYQERFSPDYIRAVNQGRQGGFFPTVLDGITGGTKEQRLWCTRTMLALLLPHEIRPTAPRGTDGVLYRKIHEYLFNFGIWKDDCIYTAYWNHGNPLRSPEQNLLISVYRRGNRLLAVCGNNAPTDITTKITCRYPVASAKNAETGTPLTIKDNSIVLPILKHDFALLEVIIKDK